MRATVTQRPAFAKASAGRPETISSVCPRGESNPHQDLRRVLLYPLSYEDKLLPILHQKTLNVKDCDNSCKKSYALKMNKNLAFPIIIVILLGLGLWWFISNTTPQDSLTPTPIPSVSPKFSGSPIPAISGQGSIILSSPKDGDSVDSPILVKGQARAFENQFMVQLQDATGKVVYQTSVMSEGGGNGQWGDYAVYILVPAGKGQNFKVEALEYSAKGDGTLGGYGSADVKLKSTDTSTINVAFVVSSDCVTTKMFPRTIIKTQSVGLVGLLELLKGPTAAEKTKGASSQIPEDTKLNSLRLSGTTAYADFNYGLDAGVAGSCRVQAIRAEIENTLKQFSTIKNVIISIDGRTEDILQP